jgi:hypothetical protein
LQRRSGRGALGWAGVSVWLWRRARSARRFASVNGVGSFTAVGSCTSSSDATRSATGAISFRQAGRVSARTLPRDPEAPVTSTSRQSTNENALAVAGNK